jgi:pilus assembly protein CpaF
MRVVPENGRGGVTVVAESPTAPEPTLDMVGDDQGKRPSLDGHDYGPITGLLQDSSVSEVMVNGPRRVYVERDGRLTLSDVRFASEEQLLLVIHNIAGFVGRRIDEDSPMVDARLPDGSRVNAVIPPLAVDGPSLTIRKFAKDPFTVDDLVGFGTLTPEAAGFLQACVQARLNILVAGGTGSGKTTTLNVLSSFIPEEERIVTIEDAAELQLRQDHKVRLESRPARLDGTGRVTIRHLVVNALRMRPDRIVIGEVRGGEGLDMLQAMNTGHDGSLTTIHANTPRDSLARLETLCLMAGLDLPQRAIREQIASAIHLIIQQARLRDGSRRITQITEVVGREGETITLQDVFLFSESGVDGNARIVGRLEPTGIRPHAMARVYSKRVPVPPPLAELYPDRKAPGFTVGVRR